MSAEQMWAGLVRDMPKGEPQEGDRGWITRAVGAGHTGWCAFLFCGGRRGSQQTRNQKGLQDALRGILEAGGDITHDWELAEL